MVNSTGMAKGRKRILFAVTTDLNYDQRMQRICRSLSSLPDYEVCIIGRAKSGSAPLEGEAYKQQRLSLFFEKGALFYLEYNIRLFIFLLFTRADLVCAVDLDTVLAVGLSRNFKPKRKYVFDAHEYFTEVPELKGRERVKSIWNWIGNRYIPAFDAAYTVGPALASRFTKDYGLYFNCFRNLSIKRKDQRLALAAENPFRLIYQGALNEGRGLKELINAMKQLPEFRLDIAGEGDLSQVLREQVRALALDEQVTFHGYLRPKDLPAFTRSADLGLNLLENKGLSYYYSLANKTFDYIQVALPGLHMNFPEYDSLYESHDCFYQIKDLREETIIGTLRAIKDDTQLYKEKIRNCIKAQDSLSWEWESQRLLQFYSSVLE